MIWGPMETLFLFTMVKAAQCISFKELYFVLLYDHLLVSMLFTCVPVLSMSFKRKGNFLSCSPLYALCLYIIGREKKST